MVDSEHPGVRLSRSRLQATASVRVPGHQWEAQVEDLSPSGALLRRPEGFDPGEAALASIEFRCGDLVALRVQARLVRIDECTVAFVFEGLGPSQEQDIRELIHKRGSLKDGVS
jgi:hypothetical protein